MDKVLLCIETSTDVCSAAVVSKERGVLSWRISEGGNHSQLLPRFVDELIGELRESKRAAGTDNNSSDRGKIIDAVAVSSGPGSYTGLRIGVSTGKGLAYGLGVPLISIPTLELLCECALAGGETEEGSMLCPMIDARRMEVFTALYDRELNEIMGLRAQVVSDGNWLPSGKIYYFGNGAEKCEEILSGEDQCVRTMRLLKGIRADARMMGRLAIRKSEEGQTVDVAYFEPLYLKEFVAAPSHIKGL